MRAVDEDFEPIPWRYVPECSPLPKSATYQERVHCRPLPNVQGRSVGTSGVKAQHIAVYHFIVKSEEDFRMKVERGGGGGTHRKWDTFTELERCATESSLIYNPGGIVLSGTNT